MLARFERLMEQAVEGSVRRVFPTTLQPVQLAKAAARAMEDAQFIGLHGIEVPNAYRVVLAPADLARFRDYGPVLQQQLGDYLQGYARERGLRPVGPLRVELVDEPTQRVGSVRAQARFVDLAPQRQVEVEQAVEGTRRLRLADLAAAQPAPAAVRQDQLLLVDRLGLRATLDPQAGLVRIGRAADNDIAIANQRVSRYHAQLRWVASSWLVYDLDSTNGTFLDGQRIAPGQPRGLRAGAVLRLGDHDLQVEPGEAG